MEADAISGQMDQQLRATGSVKATRGTQEFDADWLEYYVDKQLLRAGDRAHMQQPDGTVDADGLEAYLATDSGSGSNADFAFGHGKRVLRGHAEKLVMDGKSHYQLQGTRANTCSPGDDSWYLRAGSINLDYVSNVGVARNAWVQFEGVPILYTPWMDFPLDGGRKSGLLFPTVTTGSDGLQVSLPYYWNIAPNYDATITPRYIEQRGLMLGLEGRYLQPDYRGRIYTEQLPNDRKTDSDRYLWQLDHKQTINPQLTFGIDGTVVSDKDYYTDFGNSTAVATSSNLLREAWVNYKPSWGNVNLSASRYQTLDNGTEQYARVPKLTIASNKQFGDFSANLESEVTRFEHRTLQDGWREVAYPSVTWSMDKPWGFLKAKFGVHYTHYDLDAYNGSPATTRDRTLPITTLDSGLLFERPTSFNGRDLTQTLEPRLYFVHIPSVDQSKLPNFDTSENDLSFAQLFSENRFSGYDRINAAQQITTAVTSSLLDNQNGLEHLRVAVGQRFYLNNDDIALSGSATARQQKRSDILSTVGGDLTSALRLDTTYQYNQALAKTERFTAQLRYAPSAGKTLSVRYRSGRNELLDNAGNYGPLRTVDVAAQWPIARNWYAVGRQNYSLQDKKVLQRLAGVEYNQGCWIVRVVGERYLTDINQYKNAIYLQLELKDLSSIGSNPMETLRLAIPGYSNINNIPETE
ncbi:LPS-assembly protein LptD [Vogesella sp. LIG4]|uniref:LPS-assembly protein LptD n=1 Tax=Vogesella sp. LIG4 TaxID=1192162 RepID=UPI0018D3F2A5|nr:LPS-assembly protein LptD [Vogesella sp. LIG4]